MNRPIDFIVVTNLLDVLDCVNFPRSAISFLGLPLFYPSFISVLKDFFAKNEAHISYYVSGELKIALNQEKFGN